ncbi:aminotransferase class V-fold PLP-dependent enzyme [Arenicella xantha]|uniref:Selenocysteine lyase/cysteine desulfurase n=1 Tax=Arenicella xantha TaxID=644221 RepID=A0A395JFM9_9GAMM|nr:aminotransferase class V-fold PLP-dependent enzyme [Arenicella xantha]RBP48467.1 selenocysteine lyase/cysteine desulfurase [Arenicella xantha]
MSELPQFIGLDTQYPTADGRHLTRVHLDGAASPLAAQVAIDTINKVLPHYSNTHSYVHSSAQISSHALAWAHETVLEYLGADPIEYTAIFTGAGTTAGINRVARGLRAARPTRRVVLVSSMEHHANDLPHRHQDIEVIYLPLTGESTHQGCVDLKRYQQLCEQYREQVNYIAVSSVSNVTGIRNPIEKMTEIAHKFDIPILVDGAQSVAHGAINLSNSSVDFFVFSGHKVYTPMSPGVLVAKRSLLSTMSGQDLGGGSVETVSYFDYQLSTTYPEREQSGTPNVVGAIALAAVLKTLKEYGLETIHQRESQLVDELINGLSTVQGLTVYGSATQARTGAVAFNIAEIDHGLVAAILNDYFAIAVRNECFCAHPYVSSLLKEELWELDLSEIPDDEQEQFINRKRGMVRVSLSLYNQASDIAQLVDALHDITERLAYYQPLYNAQPDGSYTHQSFQFDWRSQLQL